MTSTTQQMAAGTLPAGASVDARIINGAAVANVAVAVIRREVDSAKPTGR